MICKYCGCTDVRAHINGCFWITPEVCSNSECVSKMEFNRDAVWYLCRNANCETEFEAISPNRCPKCGSANIVSKAAKDNITQEYPDNINEMINIQELKKLCLKFDKKYGEYPESEYEGRGIYLFFLDNSKLSDEQVNSEMEEYDKKLEEIGGK